MDKAPDAFRTISEVADELDIPQHVLRFWETRFAQIRPMKRGGGRRYYRPEDVDLLRGIRHLLYGEGYTIRGVQRILREHGVKFVQNVWQAGAAQPTHEASDEEDDTEAIEAAEGAGAAAGRRGLLGLLPGRRESDDGQTAAEPFPDRREPSVEVPAVTPPRAVKVDATAEPPRRVTPAAATAPPPPALSREDLRKLQATLHELQECRRLLDGVLGDAPPENGAAG